MTVLAPLLPLVLPVFAAFAPVGDLDPEAKEHFDRGITEYEDKAYASAIREFRVAYALDPQAVIVFAWAQAERLHGRCSRATKLYQRFLKSRPTPQQASAARQGIKRCEGQPDTVNEDPDEPTREDQASEATPTPVTPEPEPEPEPPPPPPRRRIDVAGIGMLGAGVVLEIVGAGLLGRGQNRAKDADEAMNYDEYADEAAHVRRLRISGGVLAGVGGALILAGVVKLVLHARQPRRDVSFWADPTGAGVHYRLRF